VPLKIGRVVYEILMQFFPDIIKIDFTARMEDDLDKIAEGERKWTEILHEFYKDYKPLLEKAKGRGPEYNEIFNKILAADKMCPNCKIPMVVKKGRYGMFLGCPNFPECTYKDSIINEEVVSEDKKCPKCGIPLVVKKGKFGAFYGCPNYPECKHTERIKKNAHYSRNRFKKK
jgi:DNA topoisomerase-1